MNDSEGSSKTIKVVDRRRFTEDGSPRGDEPEEQRPEPAQTSPSSATPEASAGSEPSAPRPGAQPDPAPPGDHTTPAATSQDFLELIAMLAQQAELMLVGAEGLEPQPAQAQRVIDYLGALEAKTRGNLSADEEQLLSNLVFQLRTIFVQQANS